MKPTGCESCGLPEGLTILQGESLKFDVRRVKIVRFSPKRAAADKRNRAAPQRRGYGSQTALLREGMSRVFKSFHNKILHSCKKSCINFRENQTNGNHTPEQADNPVLRYVIVTSHACIAFVLVVLLKR